MWVIEDKNFWRIIQFSQLVGMPTISNICISNWTAFSSFHLFNVCQQKVVNTIVTKKRGSEITQYSDCLHDPKRPCVPDLLHTVHTSDHHTARWLPTDSHRRPLQDQRHTSALLSRNNNAEFTSCISCLASFTQMPTKEILSSQTIYIARKHKHDPHQMFTKHQISSAV